MRLFLLIMLLFPFAAHAEKDICAEIANNAEVEDYFINNQKREIIAQGLKIAAGIPPAVLTGTCNSEGAYFIRGIDTPKEYELLCAGNGCNFGGISTLINHHGQLYLLTYTNNFNLELLSGWNELPEKERKLLSFRNSTSGLYEIRNGSIAAPIVCEQNFLAIPRKPTREAYRLIAGNKQCTDARLSDARSIFEDDSISDSLLREPWRRKFINTGHYVEIDLNKDGQEEQVTLSGDYSGRGCGCDVERISIKGVKAFPQVDELQNNLLCNQSMDIVESGGDYYFVKRMRVAAERFIKEIYPLSGENASQPICTYVNEAPVQWYRVNTPPR